MFNENKSLSSFTIYLRKYNSKMTPVDMLIWKRESYWASLLDEEVHATVFLRDEPLIGYQNQDAILTNAYEQY